MWWGVIENLYLNIEYIVNYYFYLFYIQFRFVIRQKQNLQVPPTVLKSEARTLNILDMMGDLQQMKLGIEPPLRLIFGKKIRR